MSDFFENIRKLFLNSSKDHQPDMHEPLERSAADVEAYRTWKNSMRKTRLLMGLYDRVYHRSAAETSVQFDLHFVESSSTNGFLLMYTPHVMGAKDLQHLFDFLKERVLQQGYSTYMSDVRRRVKNDEVETIERHYLKPRLKANQPDQGIEQLFGNITIEHTLLDDEPQHLKFIANIYTDHKYTEAGHYNDLLKLLVEPPSEG